MSKKKELILNLIKELEELEDISLIKQLMNNISIRVESIPFSSDEKSEIKKLAMYQENIFSEIASKQSILDAKVKLVSYLNILIDNMEMRVDLNNKIEFTEEIAKKIIRNILNNFYMHIYEMYEAKAHGRAYITNEKLKNIKIGNEYDVQRILYSIIKPIFPNSRLEVTDDTGNSSIRYDIFIEQYDLVIEVKCSRQSMTEKKLTEEIGSDGFHYTYKNIFFFIYDKDKIIKNKVSFTDTYTKKIMEKSIETIVIQPINL